MAAVDSLKRSKDEHERRSSMEISLIEVSSEKIKEEDIF